MIRINITEINRVITSAICLDREIGPKSKKAFGKCWLISLLGIGKTCRFYSYMRKKPVCRTFSRIEDAKTSLNNGWAIDRWSMSTSNNLFLDHVDKHRMLYYSITVSAHGWMPKKKALGTFMKRKCARSPSIGTGDKDRIDGRRPRSGSRSNKAIK